MRSFTFKESGRPCPICGTEKPEPAFLMPITGTEEGSNVQACQAHVECVLSIVQLYPWADGRDVIIGGRVEHFNRADYGITD
jgi:hypothetical protein